MGACRSDALRRSEMMKRILDLFVEISRSGKPLWGTLHVRLRPPPKAKRERKKFRRPESGIPINRARRTVKDGIRRMRCDENAT